jgi:RNA polymerase sigma factor (sigma-70 family)
MTDGRWGGVLDHLRRAALRGDAGPSDGHLLDCFVARRDETAFEALVRRHGPMVLGVCRRVLHDTHDTEDAFQAAFLVLARKAASIQPRDLVGNWLYGVAYRTALEARGILARRRAKERQVRAMPEPAAHQPEADGDVRTVLDEELSRLPDKYRAAVVLCELEGRSRKQVATILRIPEGTLSSRLATARQMLARRLTRRGYGVSAAALAAVFAQQASAALIPVPLVAATVQAASLFAAGTNAAAISTHVILVTEGVLKAMFLTKVKTLTAVFVLMAVLGGGLGLLGPGSNAGQPNDPKVAQKKPADPKKAAPGKIELVQDAQGKIELVQNKDVEQKLRALTAMDYKEVSLDSILDDLRTNSRLNIVVDEPALERAQISLGAPMRMRLEGVSLKTALKHLLHNARLGYRVEEGVIIITPLESERNMVLRVIPVADLVGPKEGSENLIRIIRKTIGTPRGWVPRAEDGDDPSGNLEGGTIEYFAEGKSLVVSQTAEVQMQIEALLMRLREIKKEQEKK